MGQKTIRSIAQHVVQLLGQINKIDPKREAAYLLSDFLSCTKGISYSSYTDIFQAMDTLNEKEWETLLTWVERRVKGEPLSYISGRLYFFDVLIEVNPSVLIPRPETEILVEKIADVITKEGAEGRILWDLCCGSGCIAIALKKKFPLLTVYASDLSVQALATATRNARLNHVEILFLAGDLLFPFKDKKSHYIVCNPPYLSTGEYDTLSHEVKDFEPKEALIGGKFGWEIYEKLGKELSKYLYAHGKAWFEIGYNQGTSVPGLFMDPCWKSKRVEKDWAGHDRFFFLEIE